MIKLVEENLQLTTIELSQFCFKLRTREKGIPRSRVWVQNQSKIKLNLKTNFHLELTLICFIHRSLNSM